MPGGSLVAVLMDSQVGAGSLALDMEGILLEGGSLALVGSPLAAESVVQVAECILLEELVLALIVVVGSSPSAGWPGVDRVGRRLRPGLLEVAPEDS